MEAAWDNVDCGISTILDAPFISEFSQVEWMQRFQNRCRSKRVSVAAIWVECDPDSMREYIEFRGAARDAWKMQEWDEYLKGLDFSMRPQGPHFVVDNRLGAAVAMVDEAKDVLSGEDCDPSGVILYGPPSAGKDTVSAELSHLNPAFTLFQRLKAGPGRTTGYRLTTADHINDLALAGSCCTGTPGTEPSTRSIVPR